MYAAKFVVVVALCLAATLAQAAGFRFIEVPADTAGPPLQGAIWHPCAEPPGEILLGKTTLLGVKDCPFSGNLLPLVVMSHGGGGSFIGHHDTAEALADAGFVVAAINHPGDTVRDPALKADLSIFVERPTDIRRLIDFMISASSAASHLDRRRVGVFGFSRGGYTGLVLVGAVPDWNAAVLDLCGDLPAHVCEQLKRKEHPVVPPTPDARIMALAVADPLAVVLTEKHLSEVVAPVQLWASERGGDGVSPEIAIMLDKSLLRPHEFYIVPNSGHFAFLAPCSSAFAELRPELCTDPPGFDRIAFHKEFNADLIAFFRASLGDR